MSQATVDDMKRPTLMFMSRIYYMLNLAMIFKACRMTSGFMKDSMIIKLKIRVIGFALINLRTIDEYFL